MVAIGEGALLRVGRTCVMSVDEAIRKSRNVTLGNVANVKVTAPRVSA